MQCSSCSREFQRSMAPGLICDSCWARSRGHWADSPAGRHRQRLRRSAKAQREPTTTIEASQRIGPVAPGPT
jgi:hypothetical protein